MVIPLGDRLPGRSSGLTRGLRAGHPSPPQGGLALLFGLAPGGVCRAGPVTRAAGALLPHRFTLTPESELDPGRSPLCGAVRGVTPPGR